MKKVKNTRNERIAKVISENDEAVTLRFEDDGTETTIKPATIARWYVDVSSEVVEMEIGTSEVEINTINGEVIVDGTVIDNPSNTLLEHIKDATDTLTEVVQEEPCVEGGFDPIVINENNYYLNTNYKDSKWQHDFTINGTVVVTTIWRTNGKIERSYYKDMNGKHIEGTRRKGFSTASQVIAELLNVDPVELNKIMYSIRKEVRGE